jgi:hypothetical protein
MGERVSSRKIAAVELELTPEQPAEIEAAVSAALELGLPGPDPWWEAGNREALET